MTEIMNYLFLAAGLSIAAYCFNIAWRLILADKSESQKSAARVPTFWDAIWGRGLVRADWLPDARMKSGLQYNAREDRIELNGGMSRGIFDRLFHHH